MKYRVYKKLSNNIERYWDYKTKKAIKWILTEVFLNPYFNKNFNLKRFSKYINKILKLERKVKSII